MKRDEMMRQAAVGNVLKLHVVRYTECRDVVFADDGRARGVPERGEILSVLEVLTAEGRCHRCRAALAGVWPP